MSENICEDLAHQAGFAVAVGNWIAPDGSLITGWNYDSHHWETLIKYLGDSPNTSNRLAYMNEMINQGYIRLVFRAQVMFHVGCLHKEDLWGKKLQFCTMREILQKLKNIEVHIFSKTFYVIGLTENILLHELKKLEIRELL